MPISLKVHVDRIYFVSNISIWNNLSHHALTAEFALTAELFSVYRRSILPLFMQFLFVLLYSWVYFLLALAMCMSLHSCRIFILTNLKIKKQKKIMQIHVNRP